MTPLTMWSEHLGWRDFEGLLLGRSSDGCGERTGPCALDLYCPEQRLVVSEVWRYESVILVEEGVCCRPAPLSCGCWSGDTDARGLTLERQVVVQAGV